MRTLSSTLLAAQATCTSPIVKVVLTSGATTYTFDTYSSDHRIVLLEETHSDMYSVNLHVEDSAGTLKALSLQGYSAVVSWGNTTSAGDEFSACPIMYVLAQNEHYGQGNVMVYSLAGLPNLLDGEKATADYILDDTDTQTIKTLVTALFAPTMTGFTDYPAYTLVWDDQDSLVDVVTPRSAFKSIAGQTSRKSAIDWLLSLCNQIWRVENDGYIHIFVPQTTLIDQSYTTGDDGSSFFYLGLRLAQTFTTSVIHKISSVNLKLYRVGAPDLYDGTLTVEIYAVDVNGFPTLSALASGTTDGDTLTDNTAGEWREITFTTPYKLAVDTKYAIVIYRTAGAGGNNTRWLYDASAPSYTGGNGESRDAIGVWSNLAVDFMFEEKGVDYAYSLETTGHKYYGSSYRQAMVIPGKIVVNSLKSQNPAYTGNATASDWTTRATALKQIDTSFIYVASDAQCTSIATAKLGRATMDAEKGSGIFLMNVGQELFDYISVYNPDTLETYYGNVQYIKRVFKVGAKRPYYMELRFGKMGIGGFLGTVPNQMQDITTGERVDNLESYVGTLNKLIGQTYFKNVDTGGIIINAPQFVSRKHEIINKEGFSIATGTVSWTGVSMIFNGTTYNITNSSTSNPYIWWDYSGTKTAFTSSTSKTNFEAAFDPDTDCLIGYNDATNFTFAINSTYIDGRIIITGSITADEIKALAITAGKLEATLVLSTTIVAGGATGDRVELSSTGVKVIGDSGDLSFVDSASGNTAKIYVTDAGHLVLYPANSKDIIISNSADLSLGSGVNFGLLEADTDQTLYWYDNGTLNHALAPVTDGHGDLGTKDNRLRAVYPKKIQTGDDTNENIELNAWGTGVNPDAYQTVAIIQGGVEVPYIQLKLAKFGTDTLAADVTNRGMLFFTEGGTDTADGLWCVMKKADNLYYTILVAP